MKMVSDHHVKTVGTRQVKCPLCRCYFASVEEIGKQFSASSSEQHLAERRITHIGTFIIYVFNASRFICFDFLTERNRLQTMQDSASYWSSLSL